MLTILWEKKIHIKLTKTTTTIANKLIYTTNIHILIIHNLYKLCTSSFCNTRIQKLEYDTANKKKDNDDDRYQPNWQEHQPFEEKRKPIYYFKEMIG